MADQSNLNTINGTLNVSGDWTLAHAKTIYDSIKNLSHDNITAVSARIDHLDTAGATLLHDMMVNLSTGKSHSLTVNGLTQSQQALLHLLAQGDKKQNQETPAAANDNMIIEGLETLGKRSIELWHSFLEFVSFLGETTLTLAHTILARGSLRPSSIVRHVRETGLSAIPIVSLIAFLISIVLAYQGASQLRRFGADIFTVDMVAISVLREMGVLLTAIMVAGRSGSAFTAEIGMMKVNEEVDAMRIMGVNPFEFLVLPRLLALMIAMPLLTFIADVMAILGGGLVSYSLINLDFNQFIERVHNAAGLDDFAVGMVKAPVFAFFIAVVGCHRGMSVSGSAESIGKQTTASVVQSIFLVLLLDALFSVLFTKLGI